MPSNSSQPSNAPRVSSRARDAAWWRRARRAVSDSLREHPVFNLDEPREKASREGVVEAAALIEAAREPLFHQQWLRIFLVRLRLTALIGVFCLLLFIGFYFVIFPGIAREIFGIGVVCSAGLIVQFALTFRARSLHVARLLTLLGFLLFASSLALALAWVNAPPATPAPPDSDSAGAVQFIIATSFVHILIISLVLPLRLRDTLVISAVVLGALGLGLEARPAAMQSVPPLGAIWIVGTVAGFVALLSHFNGRLRRRVFDSTFNLALQAAHLKAMSETDALLGGFNRRYAERMLLTELARAARFERPLSLLMFDLDNFKPVNDTLGHPAGDQVLRAVHEIACDRLREVDTLARYGGDEFLILLPETDAPQAKQIAARLRERVSSDLPARFSGDALRSAVTLSIGVLTLDMGHNLNLETVLERVDELLYSAKNAGKNRIVIGVETA